MNASFAALVFSWAFTAIFVPTEAQPTLPPSPPPAPNAMDSATSPPPGSTKHPSPPPPQPPISLSQLERRFPRSTSRKALPSRALSLCFAALPPPSLASTKPHRRRASNGEQQL